MTAVPLRPQISRSISGFARLGVIVFLASLAAGGYLMARGFTVLGAGRPAVHAVVAQPVSHSAPAAGHYVPIERVQVGDRVVTPGVSTGEAPGTEVDPATWKLVRLRLDGVWADGTPDPL